MSFRWNCSVTPDERIVLAFMGFAYDDMRRSWASGDRRGAAMLEFGHVDIELNLCALDNGCPSPEYFICLHDGDEWYSEGYLDEYIYDAAPAVHWLGADWTEQLRNDMARKLNAYLLRTGLDPSKPIRSDMHDLFFPTAREVGNG